jgi:hypothetical protein
VKEDRLSAVLTADGKRASAAIAAKTQPSPLHQDPHAVRDTPEKVLEVALGHEVRAFRKKLGITVADLAAPPAFRSACCPRSRTASPRRR